MRRIAVSHADILGVAMVLPLLPKGKHCILSELTCSRVQFHKCTKKSFIRTCHKINVHYNRTTHKQRGHRLDFSYSSGFQVASDLLAARPGPVSVPNYRTDPTDQQEIAAGYSPPEMSSSSPAVHSLRQERVGTGHETEANAGRNSAIQHQVGPVTPATSP